MGKKKKASFNSPEKVTRKLLQLVQESRTFDEFRAKLAGNTWFVLGSPAPEPYRTWGWSQFQKFYLDNKK